jgi:predicted PurR-regulated permease PerM
VGKAVGLPGVIVISAVLVGGNIGGVLGALIGVPLAAVIYTLLKELMDYIALKKQNEKELKATPEQLEIPN